jgi:hypothetical protein
VFHVQLRQFPHVTRAFNLERGELDARVLGPWTAGAAVELNERSWSPDKARLTVYEGPELRTEEIGLGRGWANVTRAGEDVTDRLLAEARGPSAVELFKEQILGSLPIELRALVELAGEQRQLARPSERLALAEQAVWELLHEGRATLRTRDGAGIERVDWQESLLSWGTWTDSGLKLHGP